MYVHKAIVAAFKKEKVIVGTAFMIEQTSQTFVSSSTGNIIMLHVAVPLRPHRLSRNVMLPSAGGGAEGEEGWEMLFFCVQNK